MGLIEGLAAILFGNGGNVIKNTAEIFRENTEAGAVREAERHSAALAQFTAEFNAPRKGLFDRIMDGLNRVPRPALALGTLGLFAAAMIDPIWFATRMQGVALVPEPLWWLIGAIVSFYFGARQQLKGQQFQQSMAETVARAGTVMRNIGALEALEAGARQDNGSGANPALNEWRNDA